MIDRFRLDGRVCVVTGAGRGIGRGIALGLAAAGADVIVAARRTHEIDAVAAEIVALGRGSLAVTTDVRTEEGNDALAAAAVARFGRLDAWVSNAVAPLLRAALLAVIACVCVSAPPVVSVSVFAPTFTPVMAFAVPMLSASTSV